MAEALFREVQVRMCPLLLSAYSITEMSSTVCITRSEDPAEKQRFTVGRPLPGVRVRVIDDNGGELPEESLGELAFQGPGVMRGYHRQPRETAASFDPEGFFRTGDLGIVDEEGFVHLVGRKRSVILRGGSNVYPREIEVRLHAILRCKMWWS
jgi:acyl-CoA synthetase (AMP-forming)/AMP-acid ligase II